MQARNGWKRGQRRVTNEKIFHFVFVCLVIGLILHWFMVDFPQTHFQAGRGLIQTGL